MENPKFNPKTFAKVLFLKIELSKNSNLQYALERKSAKILSIGIVELLKDNFDNDYFDNVISDLNEIII